MTSPRPQVSNATARRLFQPVEPIAVVTYMAPEPTEAVMALGAGTMWDAYFATGPRVGPTTPQCGRCPCALVSASIGGTEAHVLHALAEGMPAEPFGRVWHMPRAQLPRSWTGCAPAASWATTAGSPPLAGSSRNGSKPSPTSLPQLRTVVRSARGDDD